MTIEEIQSAISQLSPSEIARLARWLEEFKAGLWDKQIENDIAAGRLDSLIDQAHREIGAGNFSEL
jgi:hypothetical protein